MSTRKWKKAPGMVRLRATRAASPSYSPSSRVRNRPGNPSAARLGNLIQMFNNPELADVEITIGKVVLPAHRLVLCLQSKYFSDALKVGFREGSSRKLRCEPGKEQAYLRVLQYLYSGDYAAGPSNVISPEVPDDAELFVHPRVYFLADAFFIDNLKTLALAKFQETLQLVDGLESNSSACDDLVQCIEEVYANTSSRNDGLRALVAQTIADNSTALLESEAFVLLLHEGGDLAVDLLRVMAAY